MHYGTFARGTESGLGADLLCSLDPWWGLAGETPPSCVSDNTIDSWTGQTYLTTLAILLQSFLQ